MKLELGCGDAKRPGFLGLDLVRLEGVDLVANLDQGLPIASGSVDELYTSHTLEHLRELEPIMEEIHRVMKPEGRITILVPHFSNPFGYSDFTHRRFEITRQNTPPAKTQV